MEKIFEATGTKNVQILDLEDKEGRTGYIDFITTSDMENSYVRRGVDKNSRKFLAIKLTMDSEIKKRSSFVVTIFSRYVDSNTVAVGSSHYSDCIFGDNVIRNKFDFNLCVERIKYLLSGSKLNDIIFDPVFYKEEDLVQKFDDFLNGNGDFDYYILEVRNKIHKIIENKLDKWMAKNVLEFL